MEIQMLSTERVYPDGLDAAPVIARRGQSYELPDTIAAALIGDGKATAPTTSAPESKPAPGPSATKIVSPSKRKA